MTRRAKRRPPLEPQDLALFATLARAGGVRGAANLLGVPRSTVSRRLSQLEAAVGSTLVVRSSRRFSLTELGRVAAARGEQMESFLRASEEILRQAVGEPSGTLRIVAAPLIGEELFAPILAEVLVRHPQLQVEVRLSADYVDLRKEGIDLAVRTGPLEDAGDLFAKRIGTSTTGHYASPQYAAARGRPETPAELAEHSLIVVGSAARPRWTFHADGRDTAIAVEPRLRVDSFVLARAAAVEGAGIARMARFYAAPLVASGLLVPVLESYWPRVTIYAVHAGARELAPKVKSFLALLEERIGANRARLH